MIALVYTDDGPGGMCAQACSVTRPGLKVTLFDTEDALHEYLSAHSADRTGRRAQFRIISDIDDDGYDTFEDRRTH